MNTTDIRLDDAPTRHFARREPPTLVYSAPTRVNAGAEPSRSRRRRGLLLAATFVLTVGGAVTTLRPPRDGASDTRQRRSLGVSTAPASPPTRVRPPPVRRPTPAALDHAKTPTESARLLSDGRLVAAHAAYTALAVRHPDDPAYAAIATLLAPIAQRRCQTSTEVACAR